MPKANSSKRKSSSGRGSAKCSGGGGAKLKTATQRAVQQNQGRKGGGGGGCDADRNLKQMLEFARKKDIDRRKANQDQSDNDENESSISYLERIPSIISSACKLIFRVPWVDIISGQVVNITSALDDAVDLIKNACAKWNSEGWSPYQGLFKSMGMQVIDYLANFFERHVPMLHQDDQNAQENDLHKYDDENFHNKNKNENFSDDDNDEFWRGLRQSDHHHVQSNPYDEYAPYNQYHSNTRSDGERSQDYGPHQESQESRRKRAFSPIASMGRSSIFGHR